MDLVHLFIKKLSEQGYDKDSVRLFGAYDLLRQRQGSLTLSEFSRQLNINSGTLSAMLQGKRAIPLTFLGNAVDVSKYHCIIRGGSVSIQIPPAFDCDLSYLLGFLRDGTVVQESRDEYVCVFYNTNKKLIDYVGTLVKRLFDVQPELRAHWNGVYRLRIRSKTLYLFFTLLFGVKPDQSQWDTPELIKETTDKNKKSYVEGFFDAEGGVPHLEQNIDTSPKNLYIKFCQKNKEPLLFIQTYLEQKGIATRNLSCEPGQWILKIRNTSFKKFISFIHPRHPLKFKRLQLLLSLLSLRTVGTQGYGCSPVKGE